METRLLNTIMITKYFNSSTAIVVSIPYYINSGEEVLNSIKGRIHFQVSFNEIDCVRAYVRMKGKIAKKNAETSRI